MFQECRHIMPSGLRCHSPALRDEFLLLLPLEPSPLHRAKRNVRRSVPSTSHTRRLKRRPDRAHPWPQCARLIPTRFTPRRTSALRLQIAAQITARPSVLKPSDSVRSVCHEGDGDVLAPENTVCEPPADCPNCLKRDTCINPLRPFDE